jgi:hypothetical protein
MERPLSDACGVVRSGSFSCPNGSFPTSALVARAAGERQLPEHGQQGAAAWEFYRPETTHCPLLKSDSHSDSHRGNTGWMDQNSAG